MEKIFGSTAAGIVIIFLLVLAIVLLFLIYRTNVRMAELAKKYRILARKRDGSGGDKLPDIKEETQQKKAEALPRKEIRSLRAQYDKTLSKYGVVKYDAFDDVGGKLSFALAMLDGENTGFVLDAIHSRDNCFVYLKEIIKGESYIMLSEEEMQALKRAVESQDADLI